MKYLFSLPRNLVKHFHQLIDVNPDDWYATCDPQDGHVGSGGGTVWLLRSLFNKEGAGKELQEWLPCDKRILIHAGGNGRRMPAYAPSGKVLTPIPVVRWKRGQKLDQTLLDFQVPFYERIMELAPDNMHTLVASGDVMIKASEIGAIPEADVVCLGMWEEPSIACRHGVFMVDRERPGVLDHMLQKPSPQQLADLLPTHYFLMDIGVWLLSDKAVARLFEKCEGKNGMPREYDLYGDFGAALGLHPSKPDAQLDDLTVAIVALNDGKFLHYGTSPELLSSTMSLMNDTSVQRLIMHQPVKPHPSIFTQNSVVRNSIDLNVPYIWIENSFVPCTWTVSSHSIITGVPVNNWVVNLKQGQCVDVVPIGEKDYVLRPYGFTDQFRGALNNKSTQLLEMSVVKWMAKRGVELDDFSNTQDIQFAELFPVSTNLQELGSIIEWFLADNPNPEVTKLWRKMPRLSAEMISDKANLLRQNEQRKSFRALNLLALADNYAGSIFYMADLKNVAKKFCEYNLDAPQELPDTAPLMTRVHDAMFRSQLEEYKGCDGSSNSDKAFSLLRQGMMEEAMGQKSEPRLNVMEDQIVWGRSPVRADVAGGWTDTPPYSLFSGGNVVNFALNLNGQPPLHVYVKPNRDFNIVCRSIDLGSAEVVNTYDELSTFNRVGSAFSIPKAAMVLAGFHPQFSQTKYSSLRKQLEDFGAGIDIVMMAAVPAGSGLGTSSILAATVLGAVSNFCGLGWSKHEICNRTLVLEQMLTTGGGWQDQYGGVLHGIKLLQSKEGFAQTIDSSWLPETLFRHEQGACHLLYYTGIRRTAKRILVDIVRSMFLNESRSLMILDEMKQHALNMQSAIQKGDFNTYGHLLRHSWELNCRLDSGTAPEDVQRLCSMIDDLCLGYKLLGAGGGGFMYMLAKDTDAAVRLRSLLNANPISPSARIVEMDLSDTGMQISRS